MEKKTFYGTFRSQESELRDYYVTIYTNDESEARSIMETNYSGKWSTTYPEYLFNKSYFPKGELKSF